MTIAAWRDKHGLSLEALGEMLGKSKSYVWEIEQNNRAPVKLALAIERLTRGEVKAESLNIQIAEIRRAA
jgi:transcriptional regulator with XRE-family HTH domain